MDATVVVRLPLETEEKGSRQTAILKKRDESEITAFHQAPVEEKNKFAQLKSCIYICNLRVAY